MLAVLMDLMPEDVVRAGQFLQDAIGDQRLILVPFQAVEQHAEFVSPQPGRQGVIVFVPADTVRAAERGQQALADGASSKSPAS